MPQRNVTAVNSFTRNALALRIRYAQKGFPLHNRGLAGARYLGRFRTLHQFPMMIAGPRFAPMMLYEPGTGLQVKGELYEIEEERLAAIDALESVGEPGNFRRPVGVEPLGEGCRGWALAYMKAASLATPVHTGFLDDYQDRRFIPPAGGADLGQEHRP